MHALPIAHRSIHHVGYVVDDLRTAAEEFHRAFGVGPFIGFRDANAGFEELSHHHGPAVFDHSIAFAKWGDIFVELQEITAAAPAPVAAALGFGQATRVNHVAYFSQTADDDRAELERLGFPMVLRYGAGTMQASVHATGFGHSIEVHQANESLTDFYPGIAAAAEGWDGKDLLRLS